MNSRNVQTSSKDMPLRAKDHNKQSLRPLAFPLSLPFHLPTAPACNETIGTSHCGPYMSLHYTSPSNCCTAMANRPFARAWSRSCSTFLLNIVVVTGTVVGLKPQTLGSFGLILDGLIGVSTTSGPNFVAPLATCRATSRRFSTGSSCGAVQFDIHHASYGVEYRESMGLIQVD